ncbi:MAG: hypothetical protein KBF27_01330 [Cypionkella sp.]|nr:hypothetical protein [Cypionkella sp.]
MKRPLLRARGAPVILALLLAASGALRLGSGIGKAFANAETPVIAVASDPVACPVPPLALAQALTQREFALATRETANDDRMAALTLADQAVSARLKELQDAQSQLKATLSLADGAAEEDLKRLTSVYEAMKPADAAALFEAMEPDFAAGFLGRMSATSAAAVLSGMKPQSAYSISVLIAGRNALVPKT